MSFKHNRKISVHPGEVLGELLSEIGATQSALASNIGVTQSYVSDIIHGKRNITAEMAFKLEASLGLSADTWMNLQKNWEMANANPQVASGIKKLAA